MKRVIKSSTEDQYASYLIDGTVYTQKDVRRAYDKFAEATADMEEIDEDTLYDLFYDDPDIDVAVTLQVILDSLGKTISDVEKFEISPDADFECVTFTDGTKKYYFDRGVIGQGIKDADTGNIFYF